jgi:hypothetical protein
VDTTIFCEVLAVPGKSSDPNVYKQEVAQRTTEGEESLVLPIVTILETGNHIGQNGNGGQRRLCAVRFINQVKDALNGTSPFSVTALFDRDALLVWLSEFPDWVKISDKKGKGSGFGDFTIQKEYSRLCVLHPGRRVYVWSNDERLAALDREAVL